MATLASTVTRLVTTTVTQASASASSTLRATPQGGILEGSNPSVYDPKNPIITFIIQAGVIIIFCRLIHWPLSLIRQPRVIAEVVGGILLGPSVCGRIPGFTAAIFPSASIPNLTLVANIGLVLFLFLVGLEVDLRYVRSNLVPSLSVGAAGMALPFGLGCAIAWGLYNEFNDDAGTVPIAFGTYMLFVGVAMAITAFPVLCRILTELKLLSTPVGLITLSAGVSNDVVGWILLALCVALVNAGSGLTALWVLLATIAFALSLFFVVKPVFYWYLRRSGALRDGPSQSVIVTTLIIALASAFFTGVIGVHPIFGAFMAGLICPHEGGFAIKVTEKIEDIISALFLPLYFTLSGLSTNLGLLDSGIAWAYVVGIIAVAFTSKFVGGSLAARLNGLVWRESFAIGVLMSCKGLVELIVLNIGLQAKILSQRTFTIFVIMALVTTFATTPLTQWIYPPKYYRKLEAWKRGEVDWDSGRHQTDSDSTSDVVTAEKMQAKRVKSVLVYLRLDSMPILMSLVALLGTKPSDTTPKVHPSKERRSSTTAGPSIANRGPVQVHGVRLLELTDRNSSVMQVAEVDEYTRFDPVINAFKVLGQLYNLAVSGEASVVPTDLYADVLVTKASDESSDLLLIPWSETGNMGETQAISSDSVAHKLESDSYSSFVMTALDRARCNMAIFVNKGFSGTLQQRPSTLSRSMSHVSARRQAEPMLPAVDRSHHIFVPFFGGDDGRVALRLALQLAESPEVTATVVYYDVNLEGSATQQATDVAIAQPTMSTTNASDSTYFATLQRSIAVQHAERVLFEHVENANVAAAVDRAQQELAYNPKNGGNLLVVGRSQRSGQDRACFGDVGQQFVDAGVKGSLLIVQAKR